YRSQSFAAGFQFPRLAGNGNVVCLSTFGGEKVVAEFDYPTGRLIHKVPLGDREFDFNEQVPVDGGYLLKRKDSSQVKQVDGAGRTVWQSPRAERNRPAGQHGRRLRNGNILLLRSD